MENPADCSHLEYELVEETRPTCCKKSRLVGYILHCTLAFWISILLAVPSSQWLFFFLNREEQNGQTQVQGKSAVISSVVTERLLFEWSQRILLSHWLLLTYFCPRLSVGLFHVLNQSSYRSTVLDSRNMRNTVTTCHSLEKLVSSNTLYLVACQNSS